MKDRLVTLLGGVAALLIIIVLLVPPETNQHAVSKPTSVDRGEFGLRGLHRWLEANRIATVSLRRRYDSLFSHPRLPVTGNLLITSLPHSTPVNRNELDDLYAWLEEGNHVLLLMAQNDWPAWASLATEPDAEGLLKALALRFRKTSGQEASPKVTPPAGRPHTKTRIRQDQERLANLHRQPITLTPAFGHPILHAVKSLASTSYTGLQEPEWQLAGTADAAERSLLTLLVAAETHRGAVWAFRIGAGGGWVSSYPDLFSNGMLGKNDNARLLGNLIHTAVAADGVVIFDDVHFGITDLYDPQAFFRDNRFHNTLLFIGAFWLLYLIGYSNRLAPPRVPQHLPQAADFVAAVAGLCARRLSRGAVAAGLLKHFFNSVRRRHKLPQTGEPAWELLTTKATVATQDVAALQDCVRRLQAGRNLDLIKLTRLLDRITKALP